MNTETVSSVKINVNGQKATAAIRRFRNATGAVYVVVLIVNGCVQSMSPDFGKLSEAKALIAAMVKATA
jgi:hypothetical protein